MPSTLDFRGLKEARHGLKGPLFLLVSLPRTGHELGLTIRQSATVGDIKALQTGSAQSSVHTCRLRRLALESTQGRGGGGRGVGEGGKGLGEGEGQGEKG